MPPNRLLQTDGPVDAVTIFHETKYHTMTIAADEI
jgi:hypothetical protein